MDDDRIRETVRQVVREELAELLGRGDDLVPFTRIERDTGIASSTLRMRARRQEIRTFKVGRGAAVAARDLPRLLGADRA